MIKRDPNVKVYALGQHICMSAHKARRVINQIHERSYEETLMILELIPYQPCYPIFKFVYSATANACHNMGFNEVDLIISKAEANRGTILKRLKPRARGCSYLIKKPTCHITIVLKDISKDPKYFIWLRKYGWIYKDKCTDIREMYLYMIDQDRLKWATSESEVVWDKK